MHPYREAPRSTPPRGDREHAIVHGALIVVGAIPVVVALASGARLGTEATLGGLLVLLGLVGGLRPR